MSSNKPRMSNSFKIFMAALLIYLTLITMEFLSVYNTTSIRSDTQLYDKITISEVHDTSMWKISKITEVYTINSGKQYDVTFNNDGDVILCRIPKSKYEFISKDSMYEIDVEYCYIEEVYNERFNTEYDTDNIAQNVKDLPFNARAITSANFLFERYITSGVISKQEAEENFSTTYLNDLVDTADIDERIKTNKSEAHKNLGMKHDKVTAH